MQGGRNTDQPGEFSLSARPALGAALLFAIGIGLHAALPPCPIAWLAATATLTLLSMAFARRPVLCSLCLAAGVAFSGVLAAQLGESFFPRRHISELSGETPRLGEFELQIDEPPRIIANPFDQRRAMPPRQVALARVTRIRAWGGWAPATGDVQLQISQPHPRLAAGQTIRALGMLQRPAAVMNPGQFDWAGYYRAQRILATISIHRPDNLRIIREGRASILTRARERVRQLLADGFTFDRSLDHALLRALLLGDRDPQLRDVQEQFQASGTSHHLAVSGLHVAVMGGIVLFICRALCLRPRVSLGATLAFVIGYAFMALPSPPVIRAVLLSAAFGLGTLARRLNRPRPAPIGHGAGDARHRPDGALQRWLSARVWSGAGDDPLRAPRGGPDQAPRDGPGR